MGADAVHPADEILQSYGLGKLDDASSAWVSKHLDGCAPAGAGWPRCRPTASLAGYVMHEQGRKLLGRTGCFSRYRRLTVARPAGPVPPPADTMPPGLVDHPDYEDHQRAGPRRDGGGLPGPQPADGPQRGAQGDEPAPHGTARRARSVPGARSAPSAGCGTRTS